MKRLSQDEGRRVPARIADESGFTLIELLVTMVVAVIVLTGGTYGLADAFKQNTQISDRVQNVSNAETGLQRFTNDLREAVPCPTGLADAANHSLSGGLYLGAGPTLEMCDPSPGSHTVTPPPEALVIWTCTTGSAIPNVVGSAGACTRTFAPITVASATTASSGSVSSTSPIYGVKSLAVSGITGSGTTAGLATTLATGQLYSLTTVTGLSWIGLTGTFYNLTDPGNPSDVNNSDIVEKTSPVTVSTGANLENYDT